MAEDRLTNLSQFEGEARQEAGLRPQTLDEYIGQQSVKDNLKIFIEAAKLRHDPLDHVLFYGPPGLGKTTLAGIIANELGVDIKITSGPAIGRAGEIGSVEPGKKADLVFWKAVDLDMIFYRMGSNLADSVMKNGITERGWMHGFFN